MEQSWCPLKENSGPPETRERLENQSEEVDWRELHVALQQRNGRGLEMSCGQMWSLCELGSRLLIFSERTIVCS